MIPIEGFAGPIIITVGYISLYYAFQLHIMRTKIRLHAEYKARNEKFDRYFAEDREMLAADRIMLNMFEHMPPFLILLWLSAVFVGTGQATIVGGVYLAARAIYPLVLGKQLGGRVPERILIATVPGYAALTYLAGSLVYAIVN